MFFLYYYFKLFQRKSLRNQLKSKKQKHKNQNWQNGNYKIEKQKRKTKIDKMKI